MREIININEMDERKKLGEMKIEERGGMEKKKREDKTSLREERK